MRRASISRGVSLVNVDQQILAKILSFFISPQSSEASSEKTHQSRDIWSLAASCHELQRKVVLLFDIHDVVRAGDILLSHMILQYQPWSARLKSEGWLPLHVACRYQGCNYNLVYIVLRAFPGAIAEFTPRGSLSLHLLAASWGGSVRVLRLLLNSYSRASRVKTVLPAPMHEFSREIIKVPASVWQRDMINQAQQWIYMARVDLGEEEVTSARIVAKGPQEWADPTNEQKEVECDAIHPFYNILHPAPISAHPQTQMQLQMQYQMQMQMQMNIQPSQGQVGTSRSPYNSRVFQQTDFMAMQSAEEREYTQSGSQMCDSSGQHVASGTGKIGRRISGMLNKLRKRKSRKGLHSDQSSISVTFNTEKSTDNTNNDSGAGKEEIEAVCIFDPFADIESGAKKLLNDWDTNSILLEDPWIDEDPKGWLPLHYLIRFFGHEVESVRILAQANPLSLVVRCDGWLPLHLAIRYFPNDDALIEMLVNGYPGNERKREKGGGD